MLYSVPFKFDGKDYRLKIGVMELKKAQEQNILVDEELLNIEDKFKLICIALKELDSATSKLKHVNMNVNTFMQLWDESEYNVDDLNDLVEKAINLGVYKGRESKIDKLAREELEKKMKSKE